MPSQPAVTIIHPSSFTLKSIYTAHKQDTSLEPLNYKTMPAEDTHSTIRMIPEKMLGVSEPNPRWFGNPSNESGHPCWTNSNWLKSRFHFSFAEYSNPRNTSFGVLRVLNDDLVQPNRGFGEHPHRDMEICTYIVEGSLTHQDSMGTKETLDRGAIQYMTAGRGVHHSEHNLDSENPLRFIQIWITPRKNGLEPNYGSNIGDATKRKDQWHHMVADVNDKNSNAEVRINQDANIHVTELSPNSEISFPIAEGRQAYLLLMEGDGDVSIMNSTCSMTRHDAAEVFGPGDLRVASGAHGTHALLVEMAFTGPGRRDL